MSPLTLSILAAILALIAITFGGLYVLVGRVGHYEVKKKAQLREPGARTLYLLHQKGYEPLLGITIWQMLFTALFILVLINILPRVVSVFVAVTVLTLGNEVLASFVAQKFLRKNLDKLWPVLNKMLALVRPLTIPPAKFLNKRYSKSMPTIFSREHLYAILEDHSKSEVSDIKQEELSLVKAALQFSGKLVRHVMIPISEFPILERNTSVGPVLLDELFASGYSRFPVRETGQEHVVGVSSIHKLTSMKAGGAVGSSIEEVPYIAEESNLKGILSIYQYSHQTAFLVTNRFDDVVGLLPLELVVGELTGHKPSEAIETVVE
ncbi:MAG: hypothetical protein M3Q79_01180 [bacterium]|nr:hypothetical protein [bacterium]